MNERIKELADQILPNEREFNKGDPKDWGYFFSWEELEKFAELIIKEYEKLLPEICPWDQAGKEGPMKGWHVQFVARKHFGIE